MAVALDAVGPGAAGTGASAATTLSWSHTLTGSNLALAVGVALGATNSTQHGYTLSVTVGGTAMTSLGKVSANNASGGYVQLFGLVGVAAGVKTVAVTASGAPATLVGGSLSFTGAGSFGTAATAYGNTASAAVSVIGVATTNMVTSVVAGGSPMGAVSGVSTSSWLNNFSGSSAAGEAAAATAPSAAGSVTMTRALTSDWWGAVAVEVKAATAVTSYTTRWAAGVSDGMKSDTSSYQSATPVVDTALSGFTSGRALHISVPADETSTPGGTATAPTDAYQRCEQLPDLSAVSGISSGTFGSGFTGYFGLSLQLDSDFPTDPRVGGNAPAWQVITQWKNDSTGSPPVELKINQNRFTLDGNSGGWSTDLCAATAGQRYNILLQLTFTESASTSVANVWVNGTQYLSAFHPTGAGFLYTGQRSYWKVGIYRQTGLITKAKASIWYGGLTYDASQTTAATFLTDTTSDPDPVAPGVPPLQVTPFLPFFGL